MIPHVLLEIITPQNISKDPFMYAVQQYGILGPLIWPVVLFCLLAIIYSNTDIDKWVPPFVFAVITLVTMSIFIPLLFALIIAILGACSLGVLLFMGLIRKGRNL